MTARRTITKEELVLRIVEKTHQKQTVTRDIIQLFIDEVISELARGNRLELRDFGVFEVKVRKSRKARNPKTGAEVRVPEKRVVTIKPGKKMKEEINRHAEAELAQRLDPDRPLEPAVPLPGFADLLVFRIRSRVQIRFRSRFQSPLVSKSEPGWCCRQRGLQRHCRCHCCCIR